MGNHHAGRAMGLMAEFCRDMFERKEGVTALDALDRICTPYRGCDAEFGASDPDNPGRIHPVIGSYTDPHPDAALGMLMLEAFAPGGVADIDRYSPQRADLNDEEAMAEAGLRCDLWWAEIYEPFRKRYGLT